MTVNRMRQFIIVFSGLIIAVALFSGTGCGGAGGPSSSAPQSSDEDGQAGNEMKPEDTGQAKPGSNSNAIHMCGRSVLGGWFYYRGWDGDPSHPVVFGDYKLIYHEMECPPDITRSALDVASQVRRQGDHLMFFKLCFADFVGGDPDGARENLEANKGIIRSVVKGAVEEGGLTLMIGNALPMVREYTDSWLIWNHREYNAFLEDLSGQYSGRVLILDLYGTLATPDGWLRPGYASDPGDSHPNAQGYAALDKVFQAVPGRLASSP